MLPISGELYEVKPHLGFGGSNLGGASDVFC
jgi:hypothetical protein